MGLPCPPTGVGLSGGCEEGGPRTWLDKNEEAGSPFCLGDTFGRVTRDSEGREDWVLLGLEAHGVGRRERGGWGRARLKSSSGVGGGGGPGRSWAWGKTLGSVSRGDELPRPWNLHGTSLQAIADPRQVSPTPI